MNTNNDGRSLVIERPDPTTSPPTERPKPKSGEVVVISHTYTEEHEVILETMADLGLRMFPIMDIAINKETGEIRYVSFHNVPMGKSLYDDKNIILKRWDKDKEPNMGRPKIFGKPVIDEEDPEGLTQQEKEHKCHFEVYIEKEKEWGHETIHILAICECGVELDSIDIEDRLNRV